MYVCFSIALRVNCRFGRKRPLKLYEKKKGCGKVDSYIIRRRTSEGYKWYLVTPKTVNGKVKRETRACLGVAEEARKFLKNYPELYKKFLEDLGEVEKIQKYVIKSPYGYFGGRTVSNNRPFKWLKSPRMARKFLNSECDSVMDKLNNTYCINDPLEKVPV